MAQMERAEDSGLKGRGFNPPAEASKNYKFIKYIFLWMNNKYKLILVLVKF